MASAALHLFGKASCLMRLSTMAAAEELPQNASLPKGARTLCKPPERLMLPFQVKCPEGLKHPWRIWKTQLMPPPLPQGFPVCISYGHAPAPELPAVSEREGTLTSSAKGVTIFVQESWLPWAHTHTLERKHLQEPPVWLFRVTEERRGKPKLQSTLKRPLLTSTSCLFNVKFINTSWAKEPIFPFVHGVS